jgi:hypothetical protein
MIPPVPFARPVSLVVRRWLVVKHQYDDEWNGNFLSIFEPYSLYENILQYLFL